MLEHVFNLVGYSRAQRAAREFLLKLEPLSGYKAYFDGTDSGDLTLVLALLQRLPELPEVLRPWPGDRQGGPLFSIQGGHTLELRAALDGKGCPLSAGAGERHNLCITRLGEDLWGWYLEPAGASVLLNAPPGPLRLRGDGPTPRVVGGP